MSIKKSLLYICIILLIFSMYHDLQKDLSFYKRNFSNDINETQFKEQFLVIKKQIKPGDTILSLIEEVNGDVLGEVNIEQMLIDFKKINPNMNTIELKLNEHYFIPIYNTEKGLNIEQP